MFPVSPVEKGAGKRISPATVKMLNQISKQLPLPEIVCWHGQAQKLLKEQFGCFRF
ncbi:hypothetical protein EPYR_03289 [Erwinia pyrifoliae DSM 12163]|nr:hypothetical protein EPYR_03289 [Erwinia pyrifoliae DSM 12163]